MRRKIIHLFLVVLILFAGIGTTIFLISTKPPLKKKKRTVQAPVVRVVEVSAAPHRIVVRENGVARATRLVKLIPQVSGKVVFVSPSFTEGGEFKEGELLVAIDPQDYELALKLAEAEVKEAESRLAQLVAEAKISLAEWHTSAGKQVPPKLVAKEPQLKAAEARLAGAKANLERARLNLERTQIRAPFAGRVMEKSVDLGQYVAPGQPLGTIYATNAVDVVVHLPAEKLRWISVPGYNTAKRGSPVKVKARLAGGEKVWQGRVLRLGGRIDERTRLVPVIVRVKAPFRKRPPLLPGLYVTVEIEGKTIPQAIRLPLSYLHRAPGGEWEVWVVDEKGRLRFRRVEVAYMYHDEAVITAGLKSGELVVSSALSIVTDGMKVRVAK